MCVRVGERSAGGSGGVDDELVVELNYRLLQAELVRQGRVFWGRVSGVLRGGLGVCVYRGGEGVLVVVMLMMIWLQL